MRNLDRHEPLQLAIVGQINEAEAALAQHTLDPVATDLAGRGRSRNGAELFPLWFVNGFVGITHGSCLPSPSDFVASSSIPAAYCWSQSRAGGSGWIEHRIRWAVTRESWPPRR